MSESAARRYQLLQRIARGGMGEVYLGRIRGEHGFEKLVAIKRIVPELALRPDFVVRFVAEAKLAVSLSHANVVQVFDLGRAGDDLLLVMEYVEGADLARLLARLAERSQPMPVPLAVYLAMEALQGLVHAHERYEVDGRVGIIHCDLSPSNLMLSFAGEVKIGDFGLAQALAGPRPRAAGAVMGKARYLAPEQLLGEGLDGRSDLYALGVVLHEALSGQRPFGDGPVEDLVAAVLRGGLPPLSRLRADVPPTLDELLQRAVARRAAERPASARAMLAELARIARELEPVTAPDVGLWVRSLVEDPASPPGRRRTATLSAVSEPVDGGLARTTLVVRGHVDGVARLEVEPEPGAAPASARLAAVRRPGRLRTLGIGALAVTALLAIAGLARSVAGGSQERPAPPRPAGTATVAASPAGSTAGAEEGAGERPPPPPRVFHPPVPASPPAAPAPVAAARATPHRAAPGYLNVYAEPWARVTIDGQAAGATPLPRVALAPGRHRVGLRHPGWPPVERVVRIAAGRTELLDVDLEPAR